MNIKEFYKKAIYYLTVPKCVSCREILDISDKALCKSCLSDYRAYKTSDCSVCMKDIGECICVNDYLDRHFVHKLIKVFRYRRPEGPNDRMPANELIYNIKRTKRRDLLEFITDELEAALHGKINMKNLVITNVPRKKSRALQYGLDHSEEIAKSLANRLGVGYVKILKSKSALPQKKTHGEARLSNAKFTYIRCAPNIKGSRVLLIDDIVTTGASMGNCAMLIKGLGAKEIVGACLSVAYKDKYTPFVRMRYEKQ